MMLVFGIPNDIRFLNDPAYINTYQHSTRKNFLIRIGYRNFFKIELNLRDSDHN